MPSALVAMFSSVSVSFLSAYDAMLPDPDPAPGRGGDGGTDGTDAKSDSSDEDASPGLVSWSGRSVSPGSASGSPVLGRRGALRGGVGTAAAAASSSFLALAVALFLAL